MLECGLQCASDAGSCWELLGAAGDLLWSILRIPGARGNDLTSGRLPG